MDIVLPTFGVLCLLLCPRLVARRGFLVQGAVGVVVFLLLGVGYFAYDLTTFPGEAVVRGRAGLHRQMSYHILNSGRSDPYLEPGVDVPRESHAHLAAIDQYFVDKFGYGKQHLRHHAMDPRWPAFLLDWPWLMEKDPALMKEFARGNVDVLLIAWSTPSR